MDRSEPARPLSPFEKLVSAIANVPKAEVDALEAQRQAEPRTKRGPKPKDKPAA
jgi:hypothetical protein